MTQPDEQQTVAVAPSTSFVSVPEAQQQLVTQDPYVKLLLKKWGLVGQLQLHTFFYSKYYHKLQGQQLVHDLFNDSTFQQHFQVPDRKGNKKLLQGTISNISMQPMPASATRLDLFDRLMTADPPVVRKTGEGDIIKCMDDNREGFQVSDKLREMLLCEESEHAELYSPEEKQQLLWSLFELVCLGGACCQFEDQLKPYLEITKRLYKALLSVHKDPGTGKVEVASTVLEVKGCDCLPLFPHKSRNNRCLVTIDSMKRTIQVLYHAHIPWW